MFDKIGKKEITKKNQKVKHQSSCKLSVICLSTFYIYTKGSKEKPTMLETQKANN